MTETCCSRWSLTRTTPTPLAHLWWAGQRRTCSRWRRGSATTSTTRCAGSAATSTCSAHQSSPPAFDQVILSARVASAAGDAGLRARVLQAVDMLERERPAIPLFTGVAVYARGILERDAQALVAAADVLHSSSRPLLYAAAAEDAGAELARADRRDEAVDQLNAAFDTYTRHEALADARRVGRELRGWVWNVALSASRGLKRAGTASPTPSSRSSTSSRRARPIATSPTQLHLSLHTVKTHVHNAFAKLGINSRAELSKLMHGTDHPTNYILAT